VWLPSYCETGTAEVIDATGGGNTYLGGFLQGWKASGGVFEAYGYEWGWGDAASRWI
jgi:sugar/nucleoside kinase (ribokinase family)